MNISKKAAHYLKNTDIDFATFSILDIAVQDKDNAVLILAPINPNVDRYFFTQYKGKKCGFESIERMMSVLVECRHINRFYADRLIEKYNKTIQGGF
ncbi:MAG: hypothetical protein RR967_01875 [Anaerovoracaceae bacterium]